MLKLKEVDARGDDRGDIPAWLWSFVRYCLDELKIWERVYITLKDPHDMGGAYSKTYLSDGIHQACLIYPYDIDPDDPETYDTILHEVLHIAQGELTNAFARVVELIDEPRREHASKLLHDAWERDHDRLCMALSRRLYKQWREGPGAAYKPAQELPRATSEAGNDDPPDEIRSHRP